MKPITREWLNAANDDLIAMEVMLGREENQNSVHIEARFPGALGLMPHCKPSIEEAAIYSQESLKIKEQVEAFFNQSTEPNYK